MGLRPIIRLILISIGILLIGIDTHGFSQGVGWLSAAAAFFFLLPGIFGGVDRSEDGSGL